MRQQRRSASVKEWGLSRVFGRARSRTWRSLELEELVDEVPHQGVLLHEGSVARHLSAPSWGAWCGRATTRKDSIS
jgi:hypothetical protein